MRAIYELLAELVARGEPGAVATVIGTDRSAPRHEGSKMVVRADGSTAGSIGGGGIEAETIAAARAAMADGRCRRLRFDLQGQLSACGGEIEIFVEPLAPGVPFWVVGAGHVGRALVRMGRELAMRFTVVDDRPDQLALVEGAQTLCAGPVELERLFTPDLRALVLIASRHHDLDAEYLAAVCTAEARAGREAAWIGVIGSRAKAARLKRDAAERGIAAERLDRIAVPVGLAIGAETPEEIAVSVLAEALAVVRKVAWITGPAGERRGLWHQSQRPGPPKAPAGPEGR